MDDKIIRRVKALEESQKAPIETSEPFWSEDHQCMMHIVDRGLCVPMPCKNVEEWEKETAEEQAKLIQIEKERARKRYPQSS